MITKSLFNEVLIKPIQNGANTLKVVSGYASATIVADHFKKAEEGKFQLSVELLVGMIPKDGITRSGHDAFVQLSATYPMKFDCRYVFERPAVHSKVYIWLRDEEPVSGFLGSANYTPNAFYGRQNETVTECDPIAALEYFADVKTRTVSCRNEKIEDWVPIHPDVALVKEIRKSRKDLSRLAEPPEVVMSDFDNWSEPIVLPLTDRYGKVPEKSGLNWGQRENREKNQAYLSIPSSVRNQLFFPARGHHFVVLTDDGQTFICSVAQDGDKALHTPLNNSALGYYFRLRLGLAPGTFVTKRDLESYGRTDVTFYRIDQETYFMDFSAGK